ncbi:MAG: MFS transporter [Chloroflexota bacterium]
MLSRQAKIVMTAGVILIIIAFGVRQTFSLFLQPVSAHLGVGRETFSLALAWQNLIFGLPIVAIIADKLGPRWIIFVGSLLFGLSLFLVTQVTTAAMLYLNLGLLTGIALSGTTYVVILGAVAQVVPPERRSQSFGIITAAGSLGVFLIIPLAQWLLSNVGWQPALLTLAGLGVLGMVLAFGFPATPASSSANQNSTDVETDSLPQILVKARKHSGYWLLNAGFFVCGFHVAFIGTHLPAFLSDNSLPAGTGAAALTFIGGANVVGSYIFGRLGDHYRKKRLLSILYFSRAIVISLFLLIPITTVSALVFGAAIGFLWLATVPLTSGMVGQIFGSRYLSTLYGIVFLSHQVGAFLGAWWGGRVYDTTGSYGMVWTTAVILGLIAAVIHLPISDKPIVQTKEAAVPA